MLKLFQTFFLGLVATSLIARTLADVFLIQNGTSIESSIISGSVKNFVKYLAQYVSAMPFVRTFISDILN